MKNRRFTAIAWLLVCLICFTAFAAGCSDGGQPVAPTEITCSVSVQGNGQAYPDKASYKKGDDIIITVQPDNGYKLQSLTVNDENMTTSVVAGKLTLTAVQNNVAIAATFVKMGTAHEHTASSKWTYNRKYH